MGATLVDIRNFSEKLPYPLALFDTEDRLIFANAVYTKMKADNQLVGKTPHRIPLSADSTLYCKTFLLQATNEPATHAMQAHFAHHEKMLSLGRLVAGIAHELNNPINFIYGNIDFLEDNISDILGLIDNIETLPLSEETKKNIATKKADINYKFLVQDLAKLLQSLRTGAERTAGIVKDLLTFSSKNKRQSDNVSLPKILDSTVNLLAPLLRHRITIDKSIEKDIPVISCNEGHIHQVFMNLITNAAQSIQGQGTIWASMTLDDRNKQVAITFRDSGPGMSDESLRRVGEPFFTTKNVGEGTGLGLWITSNIIHNHGGTITWSNHPKGGAIFQILLPIVGERFEHNQPG